MLRRHLVLSLTSGFLLARIATSDWLGSSRCSCCLEASFSCFLLMRPDRRSYSIATVSPAKTGFGPTMQELQCNNSRRTGISIRRSQGEGLKGVNDYQLQ
ncbi:hypothetical protein B0O99DRAFT_629334 [Bisporella sp. PMI_857]|nr:hypothetical protein B0O99DRAFT_629334 [Bisporella sp. PMI_857]